MSQVTFQNNPQFLQLFQSEVRVTTNIEESDSSALSQIAENASQDISYYECPTLPPNLRKTSCQKFWRITYLVLSIILIPIGICRLLVLGIRKLAERVLVNASTHSKGYVEYYRGYFEAGLSDIIKLGHTVTKIKVKTVDGALLDGVHFQHKTRKVNEYTLLLFNANGELYESNSVPYLDLPINVVRFNIRGTGLSKGTVSPNNHLIDCWSMGQYAHKYLGVPLDQTMAGGHSQGGFFAAFTAAMHQGTPGTNEGMSLFMDRAYRYLPHVTDTLLKDLIKCCPINCCLGKAAHFITWLTGYNYNAQPYVDKVQALVWFLYHKQDRIIADKNSIKEAYRVKENTGSEAPIFKHPLLGKIEAIELTDYGTVEGYRAHNRPLTRTEKKLHKVQIAKAFKLDSKGFGDLTNSSLYF